MVEGAWGTILICWFCNLTKFKDYWFPIEVKRVLSFVDIYTNLQHSWFGIDNIEMFINILKN
jgi:hypothetical protein